MPHRCKIELAACPDPQVDRREWLQHHQASEDAPRSRTRSRDVREPNPRDARALRLGQHQAIKHWQECGEDSHSTSSEIMLGPRISCNGILRSISDSLFFCMAETTTRRPKTWNKGDHTTSLQWEKNVCATAAHSRMYGTNGSNTSRTWNINSASVNHFTAGRISAVC